MLVDKLFTDVNMPSTPGQDKRDEILKQCNNDWKCFDKVLKELNDKRSVDIEQMENDLVDRVAGSTKGKKMS